MSPRTPDIGRTKYSIMPLVSGWLRSKRYSSPSHTRSTPACSCVWITTRVASTSACSDGAAASQSGTGYEPTTVVRMRAIAPIIIHQMVNTLPRRFAGVAELEDFMTQPTPELERELAGLDGDIIILGVGGKIGPTLARLAKRAAPDKRVVGVARFSEKGLREQLAAHGIECVAADLLDRKQIDALPKLPNVIFMAGFKFGASGHEAFTWAMNGYAPALVAEAFAGSRIVAYSTGCVYPYVDVRHGGATEDTPMTPPPGAYANSC